MDQVHTTQQLHPALELFLRPTFLGALVGSPIYVWQGYRRATIVLL
jgi:hypothetical protein